MKFTDRLLFRCVAIIATITLYVYIKCSVEIYSLCRAEITRKRNNFKTVEHGMMSKRDRSFGIDNFVGIHRVKWKLRSQARKKIICI